MDLPYTYSPSSLDYDIEILVDFRCTWGGYSGSYDSPPEGPEFEINGIFYEKENQKLSLEEEKKLIEFLSHDQNFYERMCERYWDESYDQPEYE
jgi:hypothetical protein